MQCNEWFFIYSCISEAFDLTCKWTLDTSKIGQLLFPFFDKYSSSTNYMIYWNFLTQVHCGTIALSDSLGTDYKIPKTANTFFTRHIKIYENFWYIKKFKNVLCHLWACVKLQLFWEGHKNLTLWTGCENIGNAGAPVAFKSWCGRQYRVGIICPPPSWDRVKVAAKTWCVHVPTSTCPQARLQWGPLTVLRVAIIGYILATFSKC